ncbi:hypothetical protein [Thermobifida halotolerans]|uniref:hypothetical protein n=1 Tax=Thermobifida halotolerans TaxID=483545 RepID=UPI000838577E|nr:hypothetical protein [Thermobifida halotolerans]
MTMTPARLTERSGLDVLDHLEHEAAVLVLDGLQAQGDLVVVPHRSVGDAVRLPDAWKWTEVPPAGSELLRSAVGGNPHTLAAGPGTCRWTTAFHGGPGLAPGVFTATAPVYLIHAEHGGTGIAPGTYAVRRQREAPEGSPTASAGTASSAPAVSGSSPTDPSGPPSTSTAGAFRPWNRGRCRRGQRSRLKYLTIGSGVKPAFS